MKVDMEFILLTYHKVVMVEVAVQMNLITNSDIYQNKKKLL